SYARASSPTSPSFYLPLLFTPTATTEIYTLSLHDALPICPAGACADGSRGTNASRTAAAIARPLPTQSTLGSTVTSSARTENLRSEEHTSELQSRENLVCRLLLEKKKKKKKQ